MTPAYRGTVWQLWAFDYFGRPFGTKAPRPHSCRGGGNASLGHSCGRSVSGSRRAVRADASAIHRNVTVLSRCRGCISIGALPRGAGSTSRVRCRGKRCPLHVRHGRRTLVESLTAVLTADHRTLLLDICGSSLALGCGEAVGWRATVEADFGLRMELRPNSAGVQVYISRCPLGSALVTLGAQWTSALPWSRAQTPQPRA